MARGTELKVLPFMTEDEKGTKKKADQLTEKEREEYRAQLCRKISQSMSDYYSVHSEEWAEFLKAIRQEEE